MTFYFLRNGQEVGPFNWVDVYLMLEKGELDDSDLVRSDEESEFRSIETLGFWAVGADVGPLTWEEILLLREQASLKDDVTAKIEGDEKFSTLEKLLLERPSLTAQTKPGLPERFFSDHRRSVLLVSTVIILILVGLGIIIHSMTKTAPKEIVAIEEEPLREADARTLEPAAARPPRMTQQESSSVEEPVSRDSVVAAVPLLVEKQTQADNTPTHLANPAQTSQEKPVEPNAVATALPQTSESITQVTEAKPAQAAEKQTTAVATVAEVSTVLPSPTPAPQAKPTPQLSAVTSNFFQIHSIKPLNRPPRDNVGVWKVEKNERGREVSTDFLNCLEVQVSTKDGIAAKDVFAKAYFFDSSGKRIAAYKEPSKAGPKNNPGAQHSLPVIFTADNKERLFFEIPSALKGQQWQAVVVFGDKHEAKAITYPHGTRYGMLDFPEKQLVDDRSIRTIRRKKVTDRVIEYVAKTRNPKHPQITLFLRPPKGIEDWSEVQGVYALVVLANSVEEIRRRMQAVELDGDEAGSFAFANKHKLAILMWGSRSIWNPRMNYDDYERRDARELDRNFDLVANAWEEAIQHFHKEYGTPTNNFLLRGNCGAAQWAKRLCLRKPDYFLATHIHLAGSYDKPTPEAAKVLWCVTTSEKDGGYERSKRFLTACREMGYPIIYKAATPQSGIGTLGDQFFEYAMTFKEKREEYEKQQADSFRHRNLSSNALPRPWLEAFADPPFYADVVNQELFPAQEKEMIPEPFRSAIPTKRLADIWKGK